MEENTITTNEPVVEQAAATVVTAEEVKVDEVGGADEPMNAAAAPKNLINLTVKTPKEKETVSISAEANVKEVFLIYIQTSILILIKLSKRHSSRMKWAKRFRNPTTNCV